MKVQGVNFQIFSQTTNLNFLDWLEGINDMTDMEKKVIVRLFTKIVAETDLYETDKGSA